MGAAAARHLSDSDLSRRELARLAVWRASYGHRAFADDLALFAVPLAASLDWIAASRQRRWAHVVVAMRVLLSAAQMIQVWLGIMPMANVTWARYRALFLRFS